MNALTFKVFFTDERFPDLQVSNEGAINFFVVKGNKKIDTFLRFEIANRREVSLPFAKTVAMEFFDYLESHPLLLKAYSSRNLR